MTSTSIKDVSSVMKSFVAGAATGTAGNVGNTSFQDVWNQHAEKNTASENLKDKSKGMSEGVDSARRGDSLKARDAVRTERKDETASKGQVQELDEQKLKEAMEVLGTVATELMQEIADAFGMTMEELEQLMADMNMDAMDVLNPEKLSALLLEAGGVQDLSALLTDEGLCNKFQMLMNRQKELFTQLSETLQMSPEQLSQLVDEMSHYTLEQQEPQISVEVDSTLSDGESNAGALPEEAIVKAEVNVDDKATQNGGKEQNSDNANHTGNLLLQNLKADNFNANLQQVSAENTVWNETTENIMRQIMDYMKIQVKADTSSLEMQLHPASLGTLQVHVASKGGVLTANFITQNEAVKAALESQMIQLKESFAEQGVKVEAIEVTVQTHQFERNLEQGRGRQQGEAEKKGKTRRINLNTSLDMEEVENMSEEEQLTAEIMTANGSTVDYTA